MPETDPKSLADILFGPGTPELNRPEVELAEFISAWFRACRTQLPDAAHFGTPAAELLKVPRRQP